MCSGTSWKTKQQIKNNKCNPISGVDEISKQRVVYLVLCDVNEQLLLEELFQYVFGCHVNKRLQRDIKLNMVTKRVRKKAQILKDDRRIIERDNWEPLIEDEGVYLFGWRRHAHLDNDDGSCDVLLLHPLTVHLDRLDSHLGLLWRGKKHYTVVSFLDPRTICLFIFR